MTKQVRRSDQSEVKYSPKRWALLKEYRKCASTIMMAFQEAHMETIIHGSVARGDVTRKSDIDVFIPDPPSSFGIEAILEKISVSVTKRSVIQATPVYAMKAYIEIGENTVVSFPLMKLRKTEREFYKFGGEATLEDIEKSLRVCGVDKRLMLIEPADLGHCESSIVGREGQVARLLGVSVETVLDRTRALLRRGNVGRTGVFIKEELAADETFEMAMTRLAGQNPAVRRRLSAIR